MATIVFGLDGASWPLVEPWLNAGELPNIQRMREEGLWGISESVLPPVTCPNWKCYASSRTPDAHDVYWWEKVNKETTEIDIPNSGSFTSPELWDYLNDTGVSAGVMNLPMSYPPKEIDEFMIAGGPRSREENYTHPGPLEAKLEREDNYRKP
jgi:predicted AlkP superfamily phosphohydrolase/phosphomutase